MLCLRDPELIELLTGATLYKDANGLDSIGYSRRGIGAACPTPVAVEIWTKAVGATGACQLPTAGSSADAQWWRIVWPKATFTLGSATFDNSVATVDLAGFAEANPRYGNGCFNDVPTNVTLDPLSPEHYFLDEVGPPAAAGTYLSVPAQ
jgi:hypothetical protein